MRGRSPNIAALARLLLGGRRRKSSAAGLVALVIVAIILATQSRGRRSTIKDPGNGSVPEQGRVAKAVDGDTLHVEADGVRYTIRLIGVDTPEAHPSDKLDRDARRSGQDKQLIRVLGKRASAFTRELCEGKACRLEYDQANAARGHRDKYRRVLAYVFVAGAEGEILVNAEIIRQGYGLALTRYPFERARKTEFTRLARQARDAGRGLWGEWKP